ncbi:Fungal specific transcription factor domain [Ceratobasidium sp. AG-Ba]|nr:Fungal specific transcription factor domain [Ceratobasidium sp. AG-Ba]
MMNYVLGQIEQLLRTSFFQPAYHQFAHFRAVISERFQFSEAALCTKYLACKIFEAACTGKSRRNIGLYGQLLQRIEDYLESTPPEDITFTETYNRLAGTLEVTYMKLMFSAGMNTYQLLRNAAPTFLQLAFSQPSLWPDSTNFTSVPLAGILDSSNYELSRFILLDALHSMAYGLPQVVEYDTSTPPIRRGGWPSEWVHGCPLELQFALVEINNRCNAPIRVLPEPDWRPIEDRIKSWKPAGSVLHGDESWKTVAVLIIQESWRHALLVYLYMGICGVSSDDERVEASVQQIFQLIDTASTFSTPSLLIHFLSQYLVAGACARTEKQRDTVYEKLESTADTGIWLFRGCDFIPVLDHLWHGAAANGRPICWSDYVHSRQAMLPVHF